MLNAIARKDLDASAVALDGNGDSHGPLRVFEAVAIVGIDSETIGYDIELPASHLESGMLVNLHGGKLTAPAVEVKGERVFPALRVKEAGEEFQPED